MISVIAKACVFAGLALAVAGCSYNVNDEPRGQRPNANILSSTYHCCQPNTMITVEHDGRKFIVVRGGSGAATVIRHPDDEKK